MILRVMLRLPVNKRKMKKAFTLVELIIAMGILITVMASILGMVNFVSGRLKSIQIKTVSDGLRASLDIIGQKMYSANEHIVISGIDVYGFRYYNSASYSSNSPASPNMLVIVTSGVNSTPTCNYFGLNNDQLMIHQALCSGLYKSPGELQDSLTPPGIKVTAFTIKAANTDESQIMLDPDNINFIPKVKLEIKAYDLKDPSKTEITVQTTLTMDGESVNYLRTNPVSSCDGVTVYTEANYSGNSAFFPLGNYSLNDLMAKGIPNDSISSIKVGENCTVDLFYNDIPFDWQNQPGYFQAWDKTILDSNTANLSADTSSLRVVNSDKYVAYFYTYYSYLGRINGLEEGQTINFGSPIPIRSVKVKSGYSVVLYTGNNFTGIATVISADNPLITNIPDTTGFQSLKVIKN